MTMAVAGAALPPLPMTQIAFRRSKSFYRRSIGKRKQSLLFAVLLAVASGLVMHTFFFADTYLSPSSSADNKDTPRITVDAEMEAYLSSFKRLDHRPLTFFHIPKTAGTAIEHAVRQRKIPWGSCLFNHKPKKDDCQYPRGKEWPKGIGWWHVPRIFFPLENVDPYFGSEHFAVIRDPYDRMVSEFYYICTLKVFDWRPDQCQRDRLLEKEYMNEWLQQKMTNRDREGALGFLSDNGHFTAQYDFIVGPNQVRMIDYVLKMDKDFDSDFERLMHAFALDDVQLEKFNAIGAQSRDEKTHLKVADFDEKTIDTIHQLFAKDFELGYPMMNHANQRRR